MLRQGYGSVMWILAMCSVVVITSCGSSSTAVKECENDFVKEGFTLTIDRGVCYGKCPSYTATIRPNGVVEYEGRLSVTYIGDYTTTLTRAQMCKLVALVDAARYFEIDANLRDVRVMDAPVTTTRVSRNGMNHSVTRDIKASEELRALENMLDTLTYLNPDLKPR
jgi:hypothetical protein